MFIYVLKIFYISVLSNKTKNWKNNNEDKIFFNNFFYYYYDYLSHKCDWGVSDEILILNCVCFVR